MTTREDRAEVFNGAWLALIASIASVVFVVLFGAGCASKAPAAPTAEFTVPDETPVVINRTCANPNCTCDECHGDCRCQNRPDRKPEPAPAKTVSLAAPAFNQWTEGSARYGSYGDGVVYRFVPVTKTAIEYRQSCNGGTCSMQPVTVQKPTGEYKWQKVERSVLSQPATKPQVFQPRGRTRWLR